MSAPISPGAHLKKELVNEVLFFKTLIQVVNDRDTADEELINTLDFS
jgi:hypothetical protein